ncbi:dniR membrane-bound lytic murein transglycosylase D [Thermotomaculum hydrothermale]|uniref:DniR membrane-bound lytic murein transglycosylase D n=1 Tax=Thermotomaculum hydrothermale TaxID=981385 RepID=A0A7R6T0E1_9BACT|nr:lytic transglycosylase domain-containing protein [Thermotomaculum hydrothermale]BBB33645.1 dniR membrane-bound lytic murein transglycosylase D [Thermotomaculum hydrothermale]
MYSGIKIFVFISLLLGVSCANPKIEINPPENKLNVEKEVNSGIESALYYYKTGKMYSEIGYVEDAKTYFDKAVEFVYEQPDEVINNPEFKQFREDLINKIHFQETTLLAKGDAYSETEQDNDVKDEILNDGDIKLSGEEELSEKKLIESSKVTYSFPVVVNEKVLAFIKAYSTKLKPVIQATLERSGRYIDRYKEIFREQGVPEDLAYLPIIESGFKIHALSRAKAKGIWQFVRGTARLEGLRVDWWVDERCDPEKSAIAAAKHLKKLYEHYNDWYLALAAYNAGQGKVDRAIRRAKTRDFWKLAKHRWLLRRETKNYVPAFIAALIIAKNPEKYGFTDLNYEKPLEYDTVTIDSCTDLRVIAKLCNTSVRKIQELNPHLRRLTTPIRVKNFKINIPKGTKDKFIAEFSKLPPEKRVTLRYHRIKRGETLSQIARRYQTSVSAICRANGIRNKRLIRAGKTIVIPIGTGHDYYVPRVKDFTVKYRRKRYPRGKKFYYRVRRGDSLYRIARKFDTDTESIKKWNKLKSNLLRPGKKLVVYYGISTKRKESHSSVKDKIPEGFYLVREGDTIYSISRKFGLSVARLKKINNIKSNIIRPGDLLKVKDI